MPYSMYPYCGTTSHVGVSDVKWWYENYHPEVQLGEIVPCPCFFCWVEMPVGTPVLVRNAGRFGDAVKEGDSGIVERVITSNRYSLFEVKMNDGKLRLFVRSELRKDTRSSPNAFEVRAEKGTPLPD